MKAGGDSANPTPSAGSFGGLFPNGIARAHESVLVARSCSPGEGEKESKGPKAGESIALGGPTAGFIGGIEGTGDWLIGEGSHLRVSN